MTVEDLLDVRLTRISAGPSCRTRIMSIAQSDRWEPVSTWSVNQCLPAAEPVRYHNAVMTSNAASLSPGEITAALLGEVYPSSFGPKQGRLKPLSLIAQLPSLQVEMAMGALDPPVGVIPNFGSRSYYSTTMIIVLLPVTSAFVLIRIYQKTFVLKSREWEDCKFPLWFKADLLFDLGTHAFQIPASSLG